jgi:hypothetical protein
MSALLPPFPTDRATLDLLLAGLDAGCPLTVLEWLSNPSTGSPLGPEHTDVPLDLVDALAALNVSSVEVLDGPQYDWTDALRAVIRDLRATKETHT